ncbi:thioredoxin reductase glit [Pestalotiopsis sp. NC0098]|nr:thioredoxin reductase glit [Pestalotiopsis sp. NC0098]
MNTLLTDVLIIGAGPAGLAAAGGLARQLHTAVVFNSSQYRNANAKHMHNVPGFDHRPPAEFRDKSRADILARYDTIEFKDVEISRVKKLDNGRFEAVDTAGHKHLGKRLILATGVKDVMPDIPGFVELWGTGIFHCLFCHGYEERGHKSAGLLAIGPMMNTMHASGVARMASRLAGQVNVYTNGNPDFGAEVRMLLKSTKRFHIENRRVVRFEKDPAVAGSAGVLVILEDGTVNKEGFVAHAPATVQAASFAEQLGLDLAPQGHVETNAPFNSTNVPGVFAVGDCATLVKAVPPSIMMGGLAAAGVAFSLQEEEDIAE